MSVSSRRSFLKAAGTVSAAACVGTRFASGAGKHVPVGLQLYSVREQLPKDFDGTLHSLSEVGIQVIAPVLGFTVAPLGATVSAQVRVGVPIAEGAPVES